MNQSKGWTFILSFVPGLGHFYLGLMNRGLQLMIGFFAITFITSFVYFAGFLIPVIWFYSIFDALQRHQHLKDTGEASDDPLIPLEGKRESRSYLGWILIGVGAWILWEKLSDYFASFPYFSLVENVLIAGILIYIGWRMITGKSLLPGRRRS